MPAGPAMATAHRYDVLVAGGGPAGLAAAIALAERRFHVLLAGPVPDLSEPSRCEMLPDAAEAILGRLDIAAVLETAVPLRGILSLWEGERPVDSGAAPNLGFHGWSVARLCVETALRARAGVLGVEMRDLWAKTVTGSTGDWRVTLQGPKSQGPKCRAAVRCRYLIDATGRRAVLARRLGAKLDVGPNLVAVTFDLPAQARFRPHLVAEATGEGWWYALPRGGGGGTLGFVTSGAGARQAALSPRAFLKQQAAGLRLICLPKAARSCRAVLSDARSAALSPIAGRGWLAAGDASAAFDPIASQGLFNALSGGFFGGNAAADALAGDHGAAQAYAALAARTARHTHRATPRQYAASRHATSFWTARDGAGLTTRGGSDAVSTPRQLG